MSETTSSKSFDAIHQSLDEYIERDLLAMGSSVILEGQNVVDSYVTGFQNREQAVPLSLDSVFRIFSNTKLLTSVAAMTLWEEDKFKLSDPVAQYIPQFEQLKVLKPDSTDRSDTEPLEKQATVKNLMTHTAGFSYGIFLESPVDALYAANGVLHPQGTLEEMVDKLVSIPLAYQPGRRWQYSVSTDILARLVEIWSG